MDEPKKEIEKLPAEFMMNEFMNQQLTTLDKKNKKKEVKKMMMPMQMGPPKESSWEEIVAGLKISIANREKNLLMDKAQLKEAESHIKEK